MKFAALVLMVFGLSYAGCARRGVELHREELPSGEIYSLTHMPSYVPLLDGGTLLLIANVGTNDESAVRLTGGYDIYTDLRLSVARSGAVLFVRDDRMKQTWAVDLSQNSVIEREANDVEFIEVGESHRQ